jgi:hypothetical protein
MRARSCIIFIIDDLAFFHWSTLTCLINPPRVTRFTISPNTPTKFTSPYIDGLPHRLVLSPDCRSV